MKQMRGIIRRVALLGIVLMLLVSNCIPAFALEPVAKATTSSSSISYITPEQFGAKGDGVTDDTEAFQKCMSSPVKYILLSKTYLITDYLTATTEKYFYAQPKNGRCGATIICNALYEGKTLAFSDGVIFENVQFYSTILRTGTSPHGETYKRTSNIVFVEVWNKTGTFQNCSFINAVIAIRGRKSTYSTVIPQNITVKECTFTECKIPIQGYSKNTLVTDSAFINDGELYRQLDGAQVNPARYHGDLYSGDHCVYMERYGCSSLRITDCTVESKNCDSGAAFQIYGSPKSGDVIPTMTVEGCNIAANSIASASAANLVIRDTTFLEQQSEQYILRVESGSAILYNSKFYHSYAFTYAGTNVKPYAVDCTFQLLTSLSNTRCNFPFESYNCTYVNWGGNVRVQNTLFSGCVFTKDQGNVLNQLYISNSSGYKIALEDTKFRSGDTITNNVRAVTKYANCTTF